MRLKYCSSRAKLFLTHGTQFAKICVATSSVLLLLVAIEVAILWISGVKYTPHQVVQTSGIRRLSVASDCRWGVSDARLYRNAYGTGLEYRVAVHDFQLNTSLPLKIQGLNTQQVAIDPTGRSIVLACADGSIFTYSLLPQTKSFDNDSSSELKLLHRSSEQAFRDILFSPSGDYLAVAGGEAFYLFSFAERRLVNRCPFAERCSPRLLAFSPDSQNLAIYSGGDQLQLWNTAKLEQLNVLPLSGASLTAIGFSADSKTIHTVDANLNIQTLNCASGESIPQPGFQCCKNGAILPVISPDGNCFAIGRDINTIEIFDTFTGAKQFQLQDLANAFSGLVFGSNSRIFTWNVNGAIRGWNVDQQIQ